MNCARPLGQLAMLLIAACRQQPAIGYDGFAGVAWGTPVEEAQTRLGQALLPSDAEAHCAFTAATIDGHRIQLMVVDGRVVRADVTLDSSLVAPGGGRIGARASELLQAYGERLRQRAHKYTDGQYLILLSPADSMRRVVFEIADGRVFEWRIGVYPPVEYVEGCG
ncbi:MAG: hypothetical protein ACREMV_04855 [Gemmatimonadales bacterium]